MATNVSSELHNVLFIVVDNMRPSIGAYDVDIVHTPRMDQLMLLSARISVLMTVPFCRILANPRIAGKSSPEPVAIFAT